MGRRKADIDKAMEDLRYSKECELDIPFKFEYELGKLIAKHNLGDITKVPDYVTCHFLIGCLRVMRRGFLEGAR